MSKWMKLAAVVCALLFFASGIQAQFGNVEYVAAAFNFGFLGNYNSGAETLTWSEGNEATVYTTGGNSFNFDKVTIDLIFGGMTDLNPGGPQAEARFTTITSNAMAGKYTLTMSHSTIGMSISLCGELVIAGSPWAGYYEKEDGPDTNHLVGKAWVTVDTCSINGIAGLGWDMNSNDLSGIIASTTGLEDDLGDPMNIIDYQTDWNSENVLLEIWTDENYVTPEPATLGLLGLGGALLFWRRKHA